MKNKKTILITIFSIIIVIAGLYFLNYETMYSSADVLEDVDFNAEGTSVELKKIDEEADFIPISLPDKTQKDLIKAFEESKFKKGDKKSKFSNDYLMKITLNKGYTMFLDVNKKGVAIGNSDGSHDEYLIEDDNGFFNILEEAVKLN